ncbi:MAG TPA: hypothetical protein VGQ57_18750 [Polyangiaceae bacterium]|jgi:hypothetical protein|nr:hypothetical protein [Polyangiaceae bacterium]
MNLARWVSFLGAGVVLGACGGYSSLGETAGKGGADDTGTGGDSSMGAQGGTGNASGGRGMGTGMGNVGSTGMGAIGGTDEASGGNGMGNVGNTGMGAQGMGATGGTDEASGGNGMGNVGNTGMGAQGMGAAGGTTEPCTVDADCSQPKGCIMCPDGGIACGQVDCEMGQCVYPPVDCGPPPAPGCAPDDVASCDPGGAQYCTAMACVEGTLSPPGGVERGDGIFCKYFPDDAGPDFTCFQNEWCQGDLHACRCGHFEGCQVGERCEPCMGDRCDVPPGDSRCVRDVACTADNLDSCAAGPGKVCADGALACAPSTACPDMEQGAGATRCTGAKGGCCSAGEWCFDDQECRCGTHPACDASEECRLSAIGFYECQSP